MKKLSMRFVGEEGKLCLRIWNRDTLHMIDSALATTSGDHQIALHRGHLRPGGFIRLNDDGEGYLLVDIYMRCTYDVNGDNVLGLKDIILEALDTVNKRGKAKKITITKDYDDVRKLISGENLKDEVYCTLVGKPLNPFLQDKMRACTEKIDELQKKLEEVGDEIRDAYYMNTYATMAK